MRKDHGNPEQHLANKGEKPAEAIFERTVSIQCEGRPAQLHSIHRICLLITINHNLSMHWH
jgi:hypothetical protein